MKMLREILQELEGKGISHEVLRNDKSTIIIETFDSNDYHIKTVFAYCEDYYGDNREDLEISDFMIWEIDGIVFYDSSYEYRNMNENSLMKLLS